jgi:ribosomal protein L16 Arg81 hydroxylase
MITTFDELIAPITAEEFFGEYYGKKPLHIPGDADKFTHVMSWDSLNQALSVNGFWNKDNLRLYQDITPVPAEDYCRSVPGLGSRILQPDPELVKSQMSRGASLVLNSIDTISPGIQTVADLLEQTLKGYTQLNLYCSFAGHKAFGSHFDTHEVFALHTEGKKVWNIYEGRLDNPVHHAIFLDLSTEQHLQNRRELLMEVHMTPGDLLYIPRGQYHDALASSFATLHLTFGVIPVRGLDLFALMEDEAMADNFFREDLPRDDGNDTADGLRQRLSELGDRIRAMVQEPYFLEAVVQLQARRQLTRGGYNLPERPTAKEILLKAEGLRVVRRGDTYFLRGKETGIPIPSGAHDLVSWVLEHPRFLDTEVRALFAHLGHKRVDELLDQLQNMDVVGPAI